MNKKVLIVGGNSFIGHYAARRFAACGYEVTVTTRDERNAAYFADRGMRNIRLDLESAADIENLPEDEFESVVLLAGLLPANVACAADDPAVNAQYMSANVLGHIRLLNYCLRCGIRRLISTTSYADTAGLWSRDRRIDEAEPLSYSYTGDHAMYVISRNTAAEVSRLYNETYGMRNVIFRLPPVYGAGPHTRLYDNGKLRKSGIAQFMELAEQGQDIVVFGEDCYRDIVYVKDVAQALELASRSPRAAGLYNIMSGRQVSLYEQACAISRVYSAGRARVVRDRSRSHASRSYGYSISKAERELGYAPEYADVEAMMEDFKREAERADVVSFFNLEGRGRCAE